MPHVNGKFYRSAGQGYAAEKAKAGSYEKERPAVKNEPGEKGDGHEETAGAIAHIKHHGGGKYSMKLEGGKADGKHNVDSHDDMHQKLEEHFGSSSEENQDSGYEDNASGGMDTEGLKSILG